ncbi:transglutaminase domain-containing protein [Bacteroides sp.]|uniref:transglutaminase domain-containing protein n=1 Tax=Bacteroides sp. TaxID=29523 RepID=UPI0025B88DC1|nr:transglutaminase domain-containing protein [Bacteroides sp.]
MKYPSHTSSIKHFIKKVSALAYVVFCLSFQAEPVHAQEIFKDANSVIADARTEILCKSMTQSIEKESRTIIVLNRKGLEDAVFYCGCDMFRSLQKFSGEIINASGQSVRKIKKSELQKSEYSSSLTTDDYFYYYECNYPSFPFTVKYEWEIKCNNGLIGYSTFIPQMSFNQAVEKATYRIELPAGQGCRYRELNTQRVGNQSKEAGNKEAENKEAATKETETKSIEGQGIQVKESTGAEGQQIIEVTAQKLSPILKEPFGPSFAELFPRVYFAPSAFKYDKSEGDLSTWQKYGEWQYKLLDGRDLLTEPFRVKLHELTANCSTDRDKVKAVYDYLAKTTRYVSIQLGIGGLQPIAATDVCRTGFGDCKGLSNYARAMLKELGILSTYTVISTTNERLLPDFSSANQMNHVILQVPLPQDTLWLECTNPQLPFGYVHQGIAGHDALLIEPAGGRIHRLPTYPDSLNTQCIVADITLSPTAEAKISVNEISRLFQYESEAGIVYLQPNKQKDRIRSDINLSQADILNLQIKECKETAPSITFNYSVSSNQYGNKTGNRLFIPANIFRKGFSVPSVTKRTYPIHINYGYSDTDSIRIHLPDGYTIEGLPKPIDVESKFGSFHSTVEVKEKEICIVHHLFMPKGIYAPDEYVAFIAFRKLVAGQYSGKIILKKE